MTDPSPNQPPPRRVSTTVADRATAEQIVVQLTEQGVARQHVTTQPVSGPGSHTGEPNATAVRETGESDIAFTEAVGKTMGVAWVVGALVGLVVGVVGTSLLLEPPWESGLAAGLTLASAIGAAYIAGGLGLLQAGIARTGERGSKPLTEQRPGHREHAASSATAQAPAVGERIEIVVDATSDDEARIADALLSRHRDER